MKQDHVYVRVTPKLAELIEQESKKYPSKNEWSVKAFEHFIKCGKTIQYKGFVQRIMSTDFTCFVCLQENPKHPEKALKQRGALAMFDAETGATMCISCAIARKLTTRDRVKLVVQKMELREDMKAIKHELKGLADEYLMRELELSLDLNEAEMAKAFPEYEKMLDELHSWALRVRVKGISQQAWDDVVRFIEDAKELLRDHKRNMEKVIDRRKELIVRQNRKKTKKRVRV